jgi:hypothetical protein
MTLTKRTKILVGIAALVGVYIVFGPGAAPTAEPVKAAQATRIHGVRAAAAPLDITHSLAALEKRVAVATSAEALFAVHSWHVAPPPPPPPPPEALKPRGPVQPVAPPLPYEYMGSYRPEGAAPVFFLTRGDRVYDVHIGDTLDNTYSVDSFANGRLTLTYKPLNIQQQLTTGDNP